MADIQFVMPPRLKVAQQLCRLLPPLLSQKVRSWVYPSDAAYRDDYEFVVRAQTGSQFRSRTSDFHGYRFSVHGYYDWRNWAVALAVCEPGDTIIEVGANIGTETVGFSDIVGSAGSVHAFEPLPSNIAALDALVAFSGLSNVKIHRVALGSEPGTARFVVPENQSASGIGHLLGYEESAMKSIEVQVDILDNIGAAIGTARLLVMDAEGAEVSILQGAREYLSTHRPFLVLEASPRWLNRAGTTLQHLYNILVKFGYHAFCIGRTTLVPATDGEGNRAANWFCAPAPSAIAVSRVRRHLAACGWLPCIRGMNPLRRVLQ